MINNLMKGQYLVSLKMPDYIAVMKKAQKEETRKKMEAVYNSRAMAVNVPILRQVLTLRHGFFLLLFLLFHRFHLFHLFSLILFLLFFTPQFNFLLSFSSSFSFIFLLSFFVFYAYYL